MASSRRLKAPALAFWANDLTRRHTAQIVQWLVAERLTSLLPFPPPWLGDRPATAAPFAPLLQRGSADHERLWVVRHYLCIVFGQAHGLLERASTPARFGRKQANLRVRRFASATAHRVHTNIVPDRGHLLANHFRRTSLPDRRIGGIPDWGRGLIPPSSLGIVRSGSRTIPGRSGYRSALDPSHESALARLPREHSTGTAR